MSKPLGTTKAQTITRLQSNIASKVNTRLGSARPSNKGRAA